MVFKLPLGDCDQICIDCNTNLPCGGRWMDDGSPIFTTGGSGVCTTGVHVRVLSACFAMACSHHLLIAAT